VEYIEPLDVIVINQSETGVRGGTAADLGLVWAAAKRPRAFVAGIEPYPDVFTKAAALLHSIATWHPFAQGNFASAITAAFVHCEFNGYTISSADPGEEITLAEAVAAGALGIEQIAEILRNWARPTT
jgi:death on curing protein